MEKICHIRLKSIVSKHLKNKKFSVKREAEVKNLIIDIIARRNNSTLLFECETPPEYYKFQSFKNKTTESELLKLAFKPYAFVKKCFVKASNVFSRTSIIPILVVPSDYFPQYVKQRFSKIGLRAWLVDLETSKIEKFQPEKRFKPIEKKETKNKSLMNYIISYSLSKYSLGEARQKQDEIINRAMKDEKFFGRLKKYYENNEFKKLNKLIDS